MRTLRVLAILTKRQMIDNAACLVPAVLFSLVFVPAVVIAVLADELTAPSSHTIAIFTAMPVLLCVGSCALGIAQTRADRRTGVSELLSTLAAPWAAVFCARVLVGVFVILIAMVPLMVTSVILWRIMGPPAWLVRDWHADVVSGMFLVAFTSYCLGLSGRTRARALWRALAVAPLAILLVLLIVVKGFGWPLLAVLAVMLTALILESVKSRLPSCVGIGAFGLLAAIFLSLALFWGRYLSDAALTRSGLEAIEVRPRGLLTQQKDPPDASSDLEVGVDWTSWLGEGEHLFHSLYRRGGVLGVLCSPFEGCGRLLRHLGIVEYARSRKRGDYYVDDLGWGVFDFIHLDSVDGQLVYRHNDAHSWRPKDWRLAKEQYIGPKGLSDAPGSSLGRFSGPLIVTCEFIEDEQQLPRQHDISMLIVLEVQSGRFFSIDLGERTVSGGPEQGSRSDEPVRIGSPPDPDLCRIYIRLPFPSGVQDDSVVQWAECPYVPVVCESGQIELLDRNRLEIAGSVGTLPRPATLFGRGSPKPRDLLASDTVCLAVNAVRQSRQTGRAGPGEYVGSVAASVSRQGTSIYVNIFDAKGQVVASRQKQTEQRPKYMVTKYVFESLHPPVLALASFFTAYSFEAGSTHRALFLMPNSFVAQQRDRETHFFFQFCAAMLFLLPSLACAAFLSWLIDRDAASTGLSRRARQWWWLATFALGLPAYITYRLTRPRVALVFCRSCSQGRRVDQEVCHHCGSGWNSPVLEPPAWRVMSP